MNFIKFIDCRYQEVEVSKAETREFSIWKDGEANALQLVLAMVRFIIKLLFIPKVLFDYVLVVHRLQDKPQPKLEELGALAKAEQSVQNTHLKKQAKKIGMVPKEPA